LKAACRLSRTTRFTVSKSKRASTFLTENRRARSHGCLPRSTRSEPAILELATARLLKSDKPWSKERLPLVEDRVRNRLGQLSVRLGNADWLDGAFSAGDLMMVSVLLRLKSLGILDEYPNLAAYVTRGEARPAYKRAFAAQLAINTSKPPDG
jgi:glutathione S-transferase